MRVAQHWYVSEILQAILKCSQGWGPLFKEKDKAYMYMDGKEQGLTLLEAGLLTTAGLWQRNHAQGPNWALILHIGWDTSLDKAHLKSSCIPQSLAWSWQGNGYAWMPVPIKSPHWKMCCFPSISASAASASISGCFHTSGGRRKGEAPQYANYDDV